MTIGKKCGPTTTAGDCSMRVMCKDCPFNPQSVTFSYRDDWVKELENVQFEKHGFTPFCGDTFPETHDLKYWANHRN